MYKTEYFMNSDPLANQKEQPHVSQNTIQLNNVVL